MLTHILNTADQWAVQTATETAVILEMLKKELDFIQHLSLEQTKDPKIRATAHWLYLYLTWLQEGFDKLSNSRTAEDTALRQLVAQLLSLTSRKLGFTSTNTNLLRLKDPFAVHDISAIDTQTLADPAKALPLITPLDKPYTQTEAYLSIPLLRQAVIGTFPEELKQYPVLIKSSIEQEKKFPDYSVFYHGQARNFIPLYDVITGIQQWFTKQETSPDFVYLRLPQDQKNVSMNTLVDIITKDMSDVSQKVAKNLLSVNLSLFGSTFNKVMQESTFEFFTSGRSVQFPQSGLDSALENIFDRLKLPKYYIPKILEITQLLESPTGALLQIFIPTSQVNDYVQLSAPHGYPLSSAYAKSYLVLAPITIKDKSGKTVSYDLAKIDTKTYLELYKNHPEALYAMNLDNVQARIHITPDFLLNPKSGVKIYRYTTIPVEKFEEYKRKLKDIIASMMIEWENTITQADKSKTRLNR